MLSQIEIPTEPIHYFVNRVILSTSRVDGYGLLCLAELGNNMIAAWDTNGELDIYFDRTSWDFKDQSAWRLGRGAVECDEYGTVRLFGAATSANPRNFADALALARELLEPLPRVAWCQKPQAIDMPIAPAKAA